MSSASAEDNARICWVLVLECSKCPHTKMKLQSVDFLPEWADAQSESVTTWMFRSPVL